LRVDHEKIVFLHQLTYLADRREVSHKYTGAAWRVATIAKTHTLDGLRCHSVSSACSNASELAATPECQRCSVPSQQKFCFVLWHGLFLVLPKSLAGAINYFFMVYPQNYFNCSTLGAATYFVVAT
jgi:hypothetical protein